MSGIHITPQWQDVSGGFSWVNISTADHGLHTGGAGRGIEVRKRITEEQPAANDTGDPLLVSSIPQRILVRGGRLWLKSAQTQFNAVVDVSESQSVIVAGMLFIETRVDAEATVVSTSVNTIETLGLNTVNDGIGRRYRRVTSNPGHPAAFQSADGAWWDMSDDNPTITSQEFGAKWDGVTHDAVAIQAAMSWTAPRGRLLALPAGTAIIEFSMIMPSGLKITGKGKALTKLKVLASNTAGVTPLGTGINNVGSDIHVSNLTIDGNMENSPLGMTTAAALLHSYAFHGFVIEDVDLINGRGYGLGLQGYAYGGTGKAGPQTDLTVRRVNIVNCGNGRSTSSSLSSAIGAGDTSITVADGAIFDASGGTLQIENEKCRYGIPVGNVLAVVRGILGTTAVDHAAGVPVYRLVNGDGTDMKSGLRMELDQVRAELCGDKGINIRCKYLLMNQCGAVNNVTGMDINCIGAVHDVATTLTADPGAAGTTFAVVSTTDFPTSGEGRVQTEAFSWTGKTGTTLTGVVRGLHGTAAVAHSIDSDVEWDPQDDSQDTYASLYGCYAEDNLLSGFSCSAGNASGTNHFTLSSCSALRNGSGVNLSGGGSGRTYAQVLGGFFQKNISYGIYVDTMETAIISGAIVHSNIDKGIHIINCPNGGSVIDCDVRDNGGAGIAEQGSTDGWRYANRNRGNSTSYIIAGANSSLVTRNIPFSGNQTYIDTTYVQAWTPGTIASNDFAETTISATAGLGDLIWGSFNQILPPGCFLDCQAVANQVRVLLTNVSASPQTFAAGNVRVILRRATAQH